MHPFDGTRKSPWRRMALPLVVAGSLILTCAIWTSSGELTHEGGEWYTQYAGSTHTGLGKVDLVHVDARGRRSHVDRDVFVHRVYEPDCILYEPGRDQGVIHAACGTRSPVPVAFHPPWRMHGGYEATDKGLSARSDVRVVDGRVMMTVALLPIDEIRRVAHAASPLSMGRSSAAESGLALEPEYTEEPVDPAARDRNGWTPLHEAVRDSQPDVVAALLAAGADVNAGNDFGSTALLLAVDDFSPDTAMIRALLRAGADTELGDRFQMTPLLMAARSKSRLVFTLLLEHDANPCARTAEGKTIIDYADGHERMHPLALEAWRRCER